MRGSGRSRETLRWAQFGDVDADDSDADDDADDAVATAWQT